MYTYSIPDDPIIQSMERTGYPPWYFDESEDDGIYYFEEDEEENE